MRDNLLGYLLGALEPHECEQVEAQLASDRTLQSDLEILRNGLEPLESDDEQIVPPPGLVGRTCEFVTRQVTWTTPAKSPKTGELGESTSGSRWRLIDWVVASSVLAASALLFFPALQYSRVNSQVAYCKDNLRQLWYAQTGYSQNHQGNFPKVPTQGNLAAAGVYGPRLHDKQYFTDPQLVICPASSLAQNGNFSIPNAADIMKAQGEQLTELRRVMGGSYGYHLGHIQNGRLQPTRNQARSTFALMADAPSLHLANYQSANHGGHGQNVMFEDGHIQFLTNCRVRDGGDNIYCNDDGQIAPGLTADDSVISHSATAPVGFYSESYDE